MVQRRTKMIRKKGNKYQVLDSEGKEVLGEHDTREKAVKQLAAIEISKQKRGKK